MQYYTRVLCRTDQNVQSFLLSHLFLPLSYFTTCGSENKICSIQGGMEFEQGWKGVVGDCTIQTPLL